MAPCPDVKVCWRLQAVLVGSSLPLAVHLRLAISDKCLAGYINVFLPLKTAITIACARRVRLWASPEKEILQQGSASGTKSSAQSAGGSPCFARCQLL